MQKIIQALFFLILCSCQDLSRGDGNQADTENIDIQVEVVQPQLLKVTLKPSFLLAGTIYSLAFFPGDTEISFPLAKASQKEKDASMIIILEENDSFHLTTAFYKKGLKSETKDTEAIFENPFDERPVRDLNNLPVGSEAMGIIYLMTKNIGKGVILTPKGEGVIPLNELGEHEFYIQFKTSIPEWKILIGVVHVDILNPSLDFPTLTPVFNIMSPETKY